MLYIHRMACISPQRSFPEGDADLLHVQPSSENMLKAQEPSYEGIPAGMLRRMSKTVRLGIGAALPLLREAERPPDGILIGTANAGMEESIRFMQQIIEHAEGVLAPGAFVQSTPNTIAAQLSLLSVNKAYNITHVQGGLAFENALIDAAMLIQEQHDAAHLLQDSLGSAVSGEAYPSFRSYLVGGADEIGTYNYNIDRLQGWFKEEPVSSAQLYATDSPGSLAGEGAAMFLVSGQKVHALARLEALAILHTSAQSVVEDRLRALLSDHLPPGEKIDLLLSGENGDKRSLPFFADCEGVVDSAMSGIGKAVPAIARFKHMCGEYPTASGFALWLACRLLGDQDLPAHMVKRSFVSGGGKFNRILIYNNHKGLQHSFMLVTK